MKVLPIPVPSFQPLDALRFDIHCDHGFAVQQRPGEVPQAAPHLQDPAPQFLVDEAALPREVPLRTLHSFLVFQGVSRLVHCVRAYWSTTGFRLPVLDFILL
jgi:hypothetical protein